MGGKITGLGGSRELGDDVRERGGGEKWSSSGCRVGGGHGCCPTKGGVEKSRGGIRRGGGRYERRFYAAGCEKALISRAQSRAVFNVRVLRLTLPLLPLPHRICDGLRRSWFSQNRFVEAVRPQGGQLIADVRFELVAIILLQTGLGVQGLSLQAGLHSLLSSLSLVQLHSALILVGKRAESILPLTDFALPSAVCLPQKNIN